MPARLFPLNAEAQLAISLGRPVLLVGRHPECDVRLDRPQISRRHCCLALVNDRLTVRDLGSKHGVRINGRFVQEAQLQPGDEIAIGHLIFRYESAAQAAQPPRPVPHYLDPRTASTAPTPPRASAARAAEAAQPAQQGLVDFGNLDLGDVFKLSDD